MPRSTALPSKHAPGITALLGGMLGVMLYAVLCPMWAWARRSGAYSRATQLEGVVAAVLEAESAITLELEPIEEWEWRPAPWRAGHLLPARHRRALAIPLPCRKLRLCAVGRGPPSRASLSASLLTGMA